ncbi:unnamed protein product [Spirodela intermedia]|uniref:Uncharacterized protein n=1 Tax=Spirodela intermedia TaxID=51605 RepID=A0A7I8L9Y1_SPIIN|nr:unnamed protein product [Spirodela intermedia]
MIRNCRIPCELKTLFARPLTFCRITKVTLSLLFIHWTVRMDFAVLSQQKSKGLYHIEMSIRFPPCSGTHFT